MISLIACMDMNRGIGYKNELLTHLPNDLTHFKNHTKGKICVQGRKTYESIVNKLGKPLPKRTNIVLTKNKKYNREKGVFTYHSIKDLMCEQYNYGEDAEELMIIGGEQIYKEFLPYADRLYLTIIHHGFENVDAYFPKISLREWEISSHVINRPDEKHKYGYSFLTYERREL